MDWKKLGKALLFPHPAIMIALLPVATVFLIGAMVFLGTESVIAIVSYVVAAYTLTVWCMRIPLMVSAVKNAKDHNRYWLRWQNDPRLRIKASLYSSLILNTAYAVFQLWLGFYHRSFWFCSLSGYYISLAIMRFFLARYTRKNEAGQKMQEELTKYRACGWVFLLMNLALSLMIFFMVYFNRTFTHHEITTIAMAAYTFTALFLAIINILKYRKYNSPVYSAAKAISLASALVSLLTLEATMLTTFNDGSLDIITRKAMLGISGGAISAVIITMALYMIITSTRKIHQLTKEQSNGKP